MLALTLLGGILLVFLVQDVLLTVLPALGHGGPVHRRQNWILWGALRVLGRRRNGEARSRLLALAGPIMAMMSVGLWGAWLIVAFAVIYAPFPSSFSVASPDAVMAWTDALYYSGYVASTLGLGDVIATSPALRLLTVLEAMGGFALFAVATTYALAISAELTGARTLALELSCFRQVSPLPPDEGASRGFPQSGRGDAGGARWAAEWAHSLFHLANAHRQYPLLQYFRPADPERALLVQLDQILPVEKKVTPGADPGSSVPPAPTATRMLQAAVRLYLVEVNRACVPAGFRPLPGPAEDVPVKQLHVRLLRYMCYEVPPRSGAGGHGTFPPAAATDGEAPARHGDLE